VISTRRITFGDVIREHRRSRPDAVALVDGDVRLTWAELDARTSRLANALAAAGVAPGDRVLWLGQNSFRVYELLGAAAKIGAMVCPGYWRWAAPEMAFAVEDFAPRVVVWQDEEIGETVAKARAELGAKDTARWLRHDAEGEGSYEAFLAAGAPEDVEFDVDPDSALMVIYTAAISGRQCGSMLSHRNLLAMGANAAWMGDIDHTASFLNSGPMFHIGNYQVWGMPVFLHGGKNVVVRRVVAEELLPLLAAEHCTHAYLMPPTIMSLVELNKEAGHDLSSLRASIAPQLWQGMIETDTSRFTRNGGGLGRVYGQTEVTGLPVAEAFGGSGGIGNVGRPGPFSAVRILDRDGRECEIGEAGEICVRGDLVHLGYWNRPEINAERFKFGWWHTTDLGRRETDGTLSFLGTTTRMLKSAAENIFPAEVENCLESHPAVREAAVIGVPNERWAQDVKAVVMLQEGAEATEEELIDYCRSRIASYKKPKTVEFGGPLPRTPEFQKDYDALDAKYGGGGYPGGDTLKASK
jgi:long-chain acyl-CoA synthetase